MRYIPNLIPDEYKVLPKYFKGSNAPFETAKPIVKVLSFIAAITFFITAVTYYHRFWQGAIFALIGFIFLPAGHAWIEKSTKFKLTGKIKAIAICLLILLNIPIKLYYDNTEKEHSEATEHKLEAEQDAKATTKLVDRFNENYKRYICYGKSLQQNL